MPSPCHANSWSELRHKFNIHVQITEFFSLFGSYKDVDFQELCTFPYLFFLLHTHIMHLCEPSTMCILHIFENNVAK